MYAYLPVRTATVLRVALSLILFGMHSSITESIMPIITIAKQHYYYHCYSITIFQIQR
jgi:hypothetical protein